MWHTYSASPLLRAKPEDVVLPPVIVRVNDFNEQSSKEFSEGISKAHQSGQSCIPVVIDSFGGEVYALLDMIAQVQASTLPVYTLVQGKAMSCGAMLFALGKQRFMAPYATLMFHDLTTMAFGKTLEVKAVAKEMQRLSKLGFALVSRNCGHPHNWLEQQLHTRGHAEWFLTAREAARHNLCTRIGVPNLVTRISVEHHLH